MSEGAVDIRRQCHRSERLVTAPRGATLFKERKILGVIHLESVFAMNDISVSFEI